MQVSSIIHKTLQGGGEKDGSGRGGGGEDSVHVLYITVSVGHLREPSLLNDNRFINL